MTGSAATLAVHLIVLALASHSLTMSLVEDWVPFGEVRMRIWRRAPAPNHLVPGGWDPNDPSDRERFRPRLKHKIGYLLTCVLCAGAYPSLTLGICYLLWPTGTLYVAVPLAVWAVQRQISTLGK